MERLILMRHGKAEAHSDTGDDFDRPLSPRGVAEAQVMSVRLAKAGVRLDLALVSPALRTRQTWDGLQPAFPRAQVRLEAGLYNAGPEEIWRLAAGHDGAVMVVGHNPGLHELALSLMIAAEAPAADLSRAQRRFPPATTAAFVIGPEGRPNLAGFYLPGDPA